MIQVNASNPTHPDTQPNWSTFYAKGSEILAYLRNVAKKYNLDRVIKYRHTLVKAEWDEPTALWTLSFDLANEQGQVIERLTETADVVIQGQCLESSESSII
jgi:cation diffusion facilitator CzcD-associated flavoprotein CzcO